MGIDLCMFMIPGRQHYHLTIWYDTVPVYAYTFIYARVWVYICTRVGAFCLLYCPISLLHARVSQVFLNTCMRVCERFGSGVCFSLFMVSACYWCGRLYFGRGRDRGFVLYISLFLRVLGFLFLGGPQLQRNSSPIPKQ